MVRAVAWFFLALWMLAFGGQAAFAEKRVALVIGNSNYTLAPLTSPKNDADDVAAALRRLQFYVAERKDLTVREFDRAVDAFEMVAKEADVALFFFSGHGVQIDKRGYLAPTDIKAKSESSALRELVAIQEVVSRIENSAKVTVIVLDACRDSSLQERLRRIAVEKNRALVPAKGLPPVSVTGSNTLIVYSTVPGETASDGAGRNSPFTASLLKNIETPGLEIELMFKRVTADVLKATRGKQQPERLSRLQNAVSLLPAKPEALADVTPGEGEIKRGKDAVWEKKSGSQPTTTVASSDWWDLASVVSCNNSIETVGASREWPCIKPGSKQSFVDCDNCPPMAVVPSGSFIMGEPASEPGCNGSEGPQHKVTIAEPFAVGIWAVTFAEWDACAAEGGCGAYRPEDEGLGRGDRPVINVSWDDAKAYVAWLSRKTGKGYRLLSEAEREYVTRAGTTTPYWWGSTITPDMANYNGEPLRLLSPEERNREREASKRELDNLLKAGAFPTPSKKVPKTVPVKSFQANPWGLYQVHGNVLEWVEDCWHDNYKGAPTDGSAWSVGHCSHVVRGGAWNSPPIMLRAACRISFLEFVNGPGTRDNDIGFRVARTLD